MVLNGWRIFLSLCGYNVGKNVFIGMRCYLDDLEPQMLTIEDNVIISMVFSLRVMEEIKLTLR